MHTTLVNNPDLPAPLEESLKGGIPSRRRNETRRSQLPTA